MDIIQNKSTGEKLMAFGCENGKILLRLGWELQNKYLNCDNKSILDLKFSKDGSILVVLCEDDKEDNIYFFNRIDESNDNNDKEINSKQNNFTNNMKIIFD
jgi:hypothetical protein